MDQRRAAISVEGLDKTFRIPEHRVHTLKERALHPFRPVRLEELQVLRDITFQVRKGEFLGILGRNGSGKSTLLKCLAGIYKADRGRIRVRGRLAPFIELGVGFNPDLTARENVTINAVMMGLTPAEARARFDDVIAFAGLEQFVDMKLKNYSSGMQVRLAFSTMVQAGADVMLIDEVLAVGDAAFQQKCFEVFDRMRADERTIVLVTHDVRLVERFCDRAILLNDNVIEQIGDPARVGQRYLDVNFTRVLDEHGTAGVADDAGVEQLGLVDAAGRRTELAPFGELIEIVAVVRAEQALEDPEIRVWIEDDSGVRVFAASTLELHRRLEPLQPGSAWRLRVTLRNRMVSGVYHLSAMVRSHSRPAEVSAISHRAARFAVVGGEHVGGIVDVEHSLDLDPVVEAAR